MKAPKTRLGLTAVIAISISSMLGSGIFVLPAIAVTATGDQLWLAYLISAICVLPAAMSKSELATAMPASGGTYVYIERTFGPFAGTVAGLGLWLSLLLKSAFALIGIGAYLVVVATFPLKIVALTLLVAIVVLNLFGVGKIGNFLIFAVLVAIGGLLSLCVLSLFQFQPGVSQIQLDNGASNLLLGAGLVFVSYAGVTKVAAIAEEIIEPERNIPLGILISLAVVTLIYCLVSYFLVEIVDASQMDLKPIHQMALAVGGNNYAIGIALIAILTMASMANAGILAASRFPFAMARDRLLPPVFGKLGKKYYTPHFSIVLSGFIVGASILMLDVTKIAKLASAFMIMIYLLENFAVIVLRENRVQWYQPRFKTPLYPYLQVIGAFALIGLLFLMGATSLLGMALIGIPGSVLFLLYSRHRTSRMGVIGMRTRRSEFIEPDEKKETIEILEEARVVVALFGKEKSPEVLVEMAVSLSDGDKVEVAHLTEVPEQANLHDVSQSTPKIQSLRRRIWALATEKEIKVSFDPIVSHDIFKTVFEISQRLHCAWLVKEWGGKTHGAFTLHHQMGWLEDHLNCNVLTFRDSGIRYIKKILVHISEGTHEDLMLDTVNHLAQVYGARVVFSRFKTFSDERTLENLKEDCPVCTKIITLDGVNEVLAVVEATVEYDLLIIEGDSKAAFLSRFFGSKQDKIIENAACSVVAVQGYYAKK